jgi:hypothetical protein
MSSEHVPTDALCAIVLIVEDEPLQRMDMVDMAERAGRSEPTFAWLLRTSICRAPWTA